MAIQKLLLPYNFTSFDQKALDFVIRTFANREDIEITIFNAYTPVPEIETDASSVTGKLKGSLTYLSQKIAEQETELKTLKDKLLENGFVESLVHTIFQPRKKEVASEIIDIVTNNQFDIIVISHKPGKATRFFTGSRYSKVIAALRDVTVCVVS
ncbi:MAG: universal stress protein [Deltaproteobacteria bacterium]|jgi:nucleotide-binding universal stress UspA family protein|nr:universal stress protein [Deltaproteobacteria bacterium]